MSLYPKLPDDLPKTKFDTEAIDALEVLTFQEIEPFIPNILEWVQDLNWPISAKATKLVKGFGIKAAPSIKATLNKCIKTGDTIWAHNIISLFVKPFESETAILFLDELRAWWFHDNIELKILIFEIMAENRIGDQALLKKWVTINRKACEQYVEELSLIEKELEQF
ncbi:MAG: DUF5071 domain-containing protein [Bdellovibrionales bacterium]|nr:DUF5071 domain-containing protein [Bdellovibrionales bacterium]